MSIVGDKNYIKHMICGLVYKDLIKKYDQAVPRYTSYPAVPFWNKKGAQKQWLSSLKMSSDNEESVDLYIHIPFCEKLCFYCGCFRAVTKNKQRGIEYVYSLLNEWKIYFDQLKNVKINSIHFGGGTPTFLSAESLQQLLSVLRPHCSEDFVGSIEIDPRTCTTEQLDILRRFGFKRLSMGIQDFNKKVQEAINREQSFEIVKKLTSSAREMGFESINFDLIYGLPLQTKMTILQTFEKVSKLRPDMIALYSYAHLPDKMKNQKLINEVDLPVGSLKRELYDEARECLRKNGYHALGLDHFALENNYLMLAKKNERLSRNFMGYTDKKKSRLIGLGVSAISENTEFFYQNTKDIKLYIESLNRSELACETIHQKSLIDNHIAQIIQKLMCYGYVGLKDIEKCPDPSRILRELESFRKDGLLMRNSANYQVTERGSMFLRNIAAIFDQYLRREKKDDVKFSQSI